MSPIHPRCIAQDLSGSHASESPPVLGIDVSKATLDTCLLRGSRARHQRFANSTEGIGKMLEMLRGEESAAVTLVAMEATGPYSVEVATASAAAGHRVAVINPRRVLDYARACERRNKTDRVDAALIARFAAREPLPLWSPLPAEQGLLRDLLRRQGDLETQLRTEERRLEMAPAAAKVVSQSLRRSILWLTAELKRVERSVRQHLQAHDTLAADVQRLRAVPGLGEKSARLLAAEIPRHFANARAVSAWLRVVPQQCLSGTLRRASRIGHAAPLLRRKLYFAAVTAMRCNRRFAPFVERLRAKDHSKMSIIMAILHKLVRTAFAILKSGVPYQPDHVVQPALAVPPRGGVRGTVVP